MPAYTFGVDGPAVPTLLVAAYAGFETERVAEALPAMVDPSQRRAHEASQTYSELSRQVQHPTLGRTTGPVRRSLFDAGMAGWGAFVNWPREFEGLCGVVVVGSSLEDYCLFYTLLHAGYPLPVHWLPTSERLDATSGAPGASALWYQFEAVRRASLEFHASMRAALKYEPFPAPAWLLTSLSLGEAAAIEAVETIASAGPGPALDLPATRWASAGPEMSRHLGWVKEHEAFDARARAVATFSGRDLLTPVPPPTPRSVPGPEPARVFDHEWIVDAVMPARHPYPSRRSLRDLFVAFPAVSLEGGGRVTRRGTAFTSWRWNRGPGDIEQNRTPIALRSPEPSDVAAAVFGEAGLQLQPSANGRFRRETTALFGGTDAFARVITGPEYHVLRGFVRPEVGRKRQKNPRGTPGRAEVIGGWLTSDDEQGQKRWSAEVSDVAMWIASARSAAAGVCPRCRRPDRRPTEDDQRAARELVARWLSLGVLRRGMIQRCGVCAATHWYPLEDMEEAVRCYRCGRHTHMDVDGNWHYRVQEVVHQAIAQNCHVPLLTVDLLKREATGQAFVQLEDQDVWPEGGADGKMMEIDIVCFVDGEIVLGEAKAESDVGRNARERKEFARRYLHLVDALMPDRLLFATTQDEWDAAARDSLDHIRQEAARYGTRTDIWTREHFPPGTPP